MGQKTVCFYIEPAATGVESFRRYSSGSKCAGAYGYHNAENAIGAVTWSLPYHGMGDIPSDELKADLRWPKTCACGYEFTADDVWQHNTKRHFVDQASGAKHLLHDAPAGAMWNAEWMSRMGMTSPDGLWLCVRLPNGMDWFMDGPSRDVKGTLGAGWTRTGLPPKVTARPSIWAGQGEPNGWHGYLTDGVLEEC